MITADQVDLLPARFWAKIVCDVPTKCWLWVGCRIRFGYGQFRLPGLGHRRVLAHRLTYETLIGKVSDGLVLDHVCRNPQCCNPWHLEPITFSENVRRGKRAHRMADVVGLLCRVRSRVLKRVTTANVEIEMAKKQPYPNNVKRHMERLGLTQTQLAEMSGCWQTHISHLSRGLNDPHLALARRISKALCQPLEEVFPEANR